MRQLLILLLAVLILGGVAYWKFGPALNKKPTQTGPIELTVWGLWEDENVFRSLADSYKKLHPDTRVSYKPQRLLNYRTRVQTQVVNKQGPDIFVIHNTWVPMFLKTNSLSSMPESAMDVKEYTNTFYPVAKDSFLKTGQIYALPVSIDGLALFYNEDILQAGNVAVPRTWEDFRAGAAKLTVKDQTGMIKTAGAALGTTSNVDYWSDILGLLFTQQPNTSLSSPNTEAGIEVLQFYTSFAKDPLARVWDETMESSTKAFVSGKLAFYFAPFRQVSKIRAENPQLKFKTAPVPQLPRGAVGWGSFWAFAVSPVSPNQEAAWGFLKFLTTKEGEKLLYQSLTQSGGFGEIYSRVDLAGELVNDPVMGAFVNQAPLFKTWYLASDTQDLGINTEMMKLFEEAINSYLQGADAAGALTTAAKGVEQVLDKYTKIAAPQPTP